METPLVLSEAVAALNLPATYILRCVEDAKSKPRQGLIDLRYYHSPNVPTICVSINDKQTSVMTEAEGSYLAEVLKRIAEDHLTR